MPYSVISASAASSVVAAATVTGLAVIHWRTGASDGSRSARRADVARGEDPDETLALDDEHRAAVVPAHLRTAASRSRLSRPAAGRPSSRGRRPFRRPARAPKWGISGDRSPDARPPGIERHVDGAAAEGGGRS